MYRLFACLLLILSASFTKSVQSQELDYARSIVDTLASDALKGRGYVDDSDKKAAEYIQGEFKAKGIKSFTDTYYQKFNVSVNTFPHPIPFIVDNDSLEAGYDFLVEPGSPSINGTFQTIYLFPEDLLTNDTLVTKLRQSTGKLVVIPPVNENKFTEQELDRINEVISFLKYHEDNPAEGTIIITNDKLTWSAATQLNANPVFTIQADSLSTTINNVTVTLENEFYPEYQTQNVLGYVDGKNTDSLVVFIAHYDHIGILGSKAIFNGANDNASGVAMLLSLAKYYSENEPDYTTVFIAFGAEELGLLGAKHFIEYPIFKLSKIKFLMNFDLAGTGDEGIQVVNGSVYDDRFKRLRQINKTYNLLPQIKVRGSACISDHCWFDRAEVPNFYIYTLGGIQAYHDVYDRPETLPLTEFEDYFDLIVKFVSRL